MPLLQIARKALSDRCESEGADIDVGKRNPPERRHIVHGLERWPPRDPTLKKEVDRAAYDTGIGVTVMLRELVSQLLLTHLKARFLADLSAHGLLSRLVEVDESAHEVVGTPSRIIGTLTHQKFVAVIDYQCHGGSSGIGVIGEAAIATSAGIIAMLLKAR